MSEKNEIVIYTTPEGKEAFEVNLKKDTMAKVVVNLINQSN
ncbi:hypothetical protein ES704_00904 [subsurface metagenome]|jgi:hypothetical protein